MLFLSASNICGCDSDVVATIEVWAARRWCENDETMSGTNIHREPGDNATMTMTTSMMNIDRLHSDNATMKMMTSLTTDDRRQGRGFGNDEMMMWGPWCGKDGTVFSDSMVTHVSVTNYVTTMMRRQWYDGKWCSCGDNDGNGAMRRQQWLNDMVTGDNDKVLATRGRSQWIF